MCSSGVLVLGFSGFEVLVKMPKRNSIFWVQKIMQLLNRITQMNEEEQKLKENESFCLLILIFLLIFLNKRSKNAYYVYPVLAVMYKNTK